MAILGIFPADMDDRHSTTILLHTVGSFGSYIFFLIGAFTYPKLMNKTDYWKRAKKPTLIFTFLTILFGAWPFVFPNIPGLGQRIVFLFYFAWIFTQELDYTINRKNAQLLKPCIINCLFPAYLRILNLSERGFPIRFLFAKLGA